MYYETTTLTKKRIRGTGLNHLSSYDREGWRVTILTDPLLNDASFND